MTDARLTANKNRTLSKKRKRKRFARIVLRTFLILLLIAALAIGGLFIYQKMNPVVAVTYQSYTVTQGSISNALSFSGSLQLINSATYTADEASTVKSVYVAEGDNVKSGSKLIRLANGQTIEAEFDGRVNQLLTTEGSKVDASESLVQVADFTRMKVSIRVDEYDISDVKVGQTARVTVTATEQTLETTIASINYISASSGSVAYYTATAYLDVPDGVYPGMQATISIPQSEALNAVVLKLDAISFDETNQAYVLMQDSDGNMTRTYITTGVSNGNYVEIVSGLQSGDVVYAESAVKQESGNLFSNLFNFGGSQRNAANDSNRAMTQINGMQFPSGMNSNTNGGMQRSFGSTGGTSNGRSDRSR